MFNPDFLKTKLFIPNSVKGMLLMLLSTVCYTWMDTMVRLSATDVHPFEIAFFRSLFGLAVLLPWSWRREWRPIAVSDLRLLMVCGIVNAAGLQFYYLALSLSPLATVTALSFTVPLFASLFAILWLHEPSRWSRWMALGCGFLGSLVIVQPNLGIDLGSMFVLLSAGMLAWVMISMKQLTHHYFSLTISTALTAFQTPCTLVAALYVWSWPEPQAWLGLVMVGCLGSLAHFLMVQSFRLADATLVLPLNFTALPLSALLGYWVFQEIPDSWIWIGGILIFGSSTVVAIREGASKAV